MVENPEHLPHDALIAAASPAAILALIAMLRKAEGERDAAEARIVVLEGALRWFIENRETIAADLLTTHRARVDAASEWMREDDRDLRRAFRVACDAARAPLDPAQSEGEAS